MGIPKCFSQLGCLEVTLILRDYKTVTGRIIGNLGEERKKYSECKCDDHDKHDKKHDDKGCNVDVEVNIEEKHENEYDKKYDKKYDEKHDEKCCNVDVKVDVDEKCDFILLELTRDAESVSLQEIEINGALEIEWVNVEFPAGSCIAVNVCDIIYVGVNADIDEEEVVIGAGIATPTV